MVPLICWRPALLWVTLGAAACATDKTPLADTASSTTDTSPSDSGAADTACEPSAEVCNGLDDDCDGFIDDDDPDGVDDTTAWYLDDDGDGYGASGTGVLACEPPAEGYVDNSEDCDDGDATINPGVDEIWYDGLDQDCGKDDDDDADADGVAGEPAGGEDCDDNDARVYPGAPERCGNGKDDACDGDEGEDWCVVYFDEAMGVIEGDGANQMVGRNLYAAGDLDGDGYDDLATYGHHVGLGTVYGPITGGVTYMDEVELLITDHAYVALARRGVHDVDGDGSAELLAFSWADSDQGLNSKLWVVPADSSSVGTSEELGFALEAALDDIGGFGHNHDPGGDLNADGWPDLLVYGGGSNEGSSRGTAAFLYGPITGPRTVSEDTDVLYRGEVDHHYMGRGLAGLGDVDGDGYDDAAISAPCGLTEASDTCAETSPRVYPSVWLLRGPVSAADHPDDVAAARIDISILQLTALDDVTGDGVPDLGLSQVQAYGRDADRVFVVSGDLEGTYDGIYDDSDEFAAAVVEGDSYSDRMDGDSLESVADLNGDGARELMLSDGSLSNEYGVGRLTLLFLGPVSGRMTASGCRAEIGRDWVTSGGATAYPSVVAGDVDGDGSVDLALGTPSADSNGESGSGAVYIVSGASLLED